MSLIDDALKRAQAAGGGEAARPTNRPWTPTPLPDPGIARRRAIVRWAGIASAVTALVLVGGWLVRRELTSSPHPLPAGADQQRETLGSRQRRPEGPALSGRGEGRPAAALAPQPTATPDAVALATPIIVAQPPVTRPPRIAAPTPATSETETVVKPAPPAPRAPQAVADGKTYAGSVALPGGAKIELGGIVWSETEPRALLNDRIAAVGAFVEGYSLTKIEENRVALEKDGVTIYISVK